MSSRIPHDEVAAFVRAYPDRTGYAAAIAAKYGISVRTAHSWIHQCRLKGLLPSGDEPRPCRACGGTGVTRWGNRWAAETGNQS